MASYARRSISKDSSLNNFCANIPFMELKSAYHPKEVEEKWYRFWEENKFFEADPNSSKPPFCIVLPPPNVTGVLHMGHALVDTLQDILIRYKRMSGFETLWAPGTDHAGIATQTVVERHLFAKTGKRRKDFPREDFLAEIWDFKEKNEKTIIKQLKKLGCSCDWSRLRFTMDEKSNRAVHTLFKKMYDDGLIYWGDYLVNWDPVAQTALADDEVEYEDKEGSLYHFKYSLQESSGFITIATTRPETMLGDVAIAVHPEDSRFQSLLGKKVILPIIKRELPIIPDPFVDPEFGTGAVKITPAHDPNDYEMGLRHDLDFVNIMTPDGKINANGNEFEGLSMKEAREAVVQKMKELGYLEKIEPHSLRIGVSYRSKAVIEPYLSKQWFIKMNAFKEKLLSAVREKRVELIPPHWESTYNHWIENLRDWCISRQLWWGHRIPIWYHKEDPEKIICYEGEGLPPQVEKNPDNYKQDEDVLDTWFSSALWPETILGWPEKTSELKKFYPTSTLITGHDILFFWVARMIVMGEYVLDEVPFHQSFIHGLIYGKSYWREDAEGSIQYVSYEEKVEYDLGKQPPKGVHSKWEKMSKSKGNIIDPLEIISTYGADAMRMALTSSVTFARQIDLDRRRFEEFKNFANKIWNGARFIFMNLEGLTPASLSEGLNYELLTLEDRWILSLLNRNIENVRNFLDQYAYDRAALNAYDFFWKEFCSYYLELVKPILFGKSGDEKIKENKQKLLVILLCNIIRLLHPMAPFITEELFSLLKKQFSAAKATSETDPYTKETIEALHASACIVSPFPEVISKTDINPNVEQQFTFISNIIHAVRNIRAEMKIPLNEKTDLHIHGTDEHPDWQLALQNEPLFHALLRLENIHFTLEAPKGFGSTAVVGSLKLLVPLPEHLKEKEKVRLRKKKEKILKSYDATKKKLQQPEFLERAPSEVIDKMKLTLSQTEQKLEEIESKLSSL